jgi:hypothetical protein
MALCLTSLICNKDILMKRIGLLMLLLSPIAYADTPLWTFTPLTATSISVPSTGSATIQYEVTNQSSKSHTLDMQNIQGITQLTTSGNCTDPFPLGAKQSCVLSLNVDGAALTGNVTSGPVVCQQGSSLQCYQPSAQDSLNITLTPVAPTTTLSISFAELALETSGTPRILTITNTGSYVAENLTISFPTWPSGTTAGTNCGSTLDPFGSCTVTVTPGANATSDCNAGQGSIPTPDVITINASNSNTITTNVVVVTYGCVYQEGYIFGIDDSTPDNISITGTTAGAFDVGSLSWGSTSITTGATSLVDGITNTVEIVTSQPSSATAAKTCSEFEIDSSGNSPCISGTCYTNWYLPAICQMSAQGGSAGCPAAIPNIETNLHNLISGCSGSECLSAEHWSSTEFDQPEAFYIYFQSGTSITQEAVKTTSFQTRCARDF